MPLSVPLDVPTMAALIRAVLTGGPYPDMARAIPLLLGTMAQESQFIYPEQLGGGPALGFLMIEGATEVSVWDDYLAYRPDERTWLIARCGVEGPNSEALHWSLPYGILLARVLYFWRDPDRLPEAHDLDGQWERYKKYYNTIYGSATQEQYITNYQTLVAPFYPRRGRVA